MARSVSRRSGWFRAAALAGGVLAVFAVIPVQAASAHAYLAASNPADGSVLPEAPRQLSMDFSEAVVQDATSLDLADASGTHVAVRDVRVSAGNPGADSEAPVTLTATLPALTRGAYRLSWRTLSRDDLHATSGVIVFGVGVTVAAAGFTEPAPNVDEASLRWLLFGTISIAFGGLLALRLLRRTGGRAPDIALARRSVVVGGSAAAVVAGVLLWAQVAGARVPILDAVGGRYGLGWTIREIGLLTLVAATRGVRPVRAVTAGCAVVSVSAGTALTGHNGATGVSYLVADALHLAAAATWIGAMIVLAVCVARRSAGRDAASLRSALLAFGRPAAACVGIMILTGLYLSSAAVGSVDAALETNYGRTLIVKLAAFAVALLLAAVNHRRLRTVTRAVPLRTIAAEASVGVVILLLAAVLASSQPAMEARFIGTPAAAGTTPVLATPSADLQQDLAVTPNRPGHNLLLLRVMNSRRPAPGPVLAVTVRLRGPDGAQGQAITTQQSPGGRWSAPADLAAGGAVSAEVTVVRAGLPDVVSTFSWTVAASGDSRPVVVSAAALRAPLQAAVALLLLAAVAGCMIQSYRSRRTGAALEAPVPVQRDRTQDPVEVGGTPSP